MSSTSIPKTDNDNDNDNETISTTSSTSSSTSPSPVTQSTTTTSSSSSTSASSSGLCFRTELFADPQFNVDHFVSELRNKGVTLPTLNKDLDRYHQLLRRELVDLINNDYADIVSLSTNLVGIENVIQTLRHSLSLVKQQVHDTHESVSETLHGFEEQLARHRALAQRENTLQLCLNISHSVSKMERLLHTSESYNMVQQSKTEMESGQSILKSPHKDNDSSADNDNSQLNDNDDDDSNSQVQQVQALCHFLERIATEFNHMQYHVSCADDIAFVNALGVRIKLVEKVFHERLRHAFNEAMKTETHQVVLQCLRSYSIIGNPQDAEQHVRNAFVRPVFKQLFSPTNLKQIGITGIYDGVMDFINNELSLLFELTQSDSAVLSGYNFLSSSVFSELVHQITNQIPQIFSYGIAPAFHANYKATLAFLDTFESHFSTLQQVTEFRKSDHFRQFMSEWNLIIYFQLRFKEIAGSLEQALDVNVRMLDHLNVEDVASKPFVMPPTNILVQSLQRCWDDDIFIAQLGHKFLRLSLQLFARYVYWVQQMIQETDSASTDQSNSASGVSSSGASTTSTSGKPLYVDHLIILDKDVQKLQVWMSTYVHDNILPQLVDSQMVESNDVQPLVQQCMDEVQTQLDETRRKISDEIVRQVYLRCNDILPRVKQMRRTTTMQRKSEDALQPSTIIIQILRPFEMFMNTLDADNASSSSRIVDISVNDNTKKEWATQIISELTPRYFDEVKNLIDSIQSTKDSLSKLGGRRGAGGADSLEKVKNQLKVDLEEYERMIGVFQVDLDSIDGFKDLLELTK